MNVQRQGRVFEPGAQNQFKPVHQPDSPVQYRSAAVPSSPSVRQYTQAGGGPSSQQLQPTSYGQPQNSATVGTRGRYDESGGNSRGSALDGGSRAGEFCPRNADPTEEDPLQNPRPPEQDTDQLAQSRVQPRYSSCHHQEQNFIYRAKRWSARLSGRASLLWGAGQEGDPPPPVPRHRNQSKYNQTTSDANHIRLFEEKTRAYTCRELLCIVFLPCFLICLLGIALSSLIIYYQIGKEYEQELEGLEQELTLTREKEGVYLTSQKYKELISAVNSQKLVEENGQDAVEELGSVLKAKEAVIQDLESKVEKLSQTLDCTYTVIQTGGSSQLLEHLDLKCKLSQRAQLLLAVSDEAVQDKPDSRRRSEDRTRLGEAGKPVRHHHHQHSSGKQGHHTNQQEEGDTQHWLLGAKRGEKSESGEFQQFLVTELTRMEQNILDFSSQHDSFCSEFRLSLEGEVERRRQDLASLANKLTALIENQAKAIGKLETLASEQMYAEQKWVTSYLKNTRNEADRQSTSLQGFLTDSFLPGIRTLGVSVREVSTSLSSLHSSLTSHLQGSSTHLTAFLDSQKKLVLSTKDTVMSLSQLQHAELQVLTGREEEVRKANDQFGTRFREARRKIDGLLSSIMLEYEQYSTVLNKSSEASLKTLSSLTSRSQTIQSTVNIAANEGAGKNAAFRSRQSELTQKFTSELSGYMETALTQTKTLSSGVDNLELQTKQMVGERKGAWELHYSNSEIMLRKKSDKNKELLQKHQTQTQETHTDLRQFRNELESVADHQRQIDITHTAERQADLQAQCKSMSGFTQLLSSELHARDSDLANYFVNTERN